ncbi:hypothetical protein K3495_g2533 [Podosphaera aphanis]|nr:hypothetical protein K3495_g2533 [Podosphaera aphanis]
MAKHLASVAELVVELHANIDRINQTVQSLSETSHQHKLENLAAERETAILSLREKRVDALKKLLAQRLKEKEKTEEKRRKEREEIEEERRREWEEILAKRKRDDEERAKAFEAEDLEIERLRNEEDDEREMEREEEERALFEKCELEMEKLEDEIQKKHEEGVLTLKQLDEERKVIKNPYYLLIPKKLFTDYKKLQAINARIEAALSTPTVVPKLTLRSRRRTNFGTPDQRAVEEFDQQNPKFSDQPAKADILSAANNNDVGKSNDDDMTNEILRSQHISNVDPGDSKILKDCVPEISKPFPISGIEVRDKLLEDRGGKKSSLIEEKHEKENATNAFNIVEQEEKSQPTTTAKIIAIKAPKILNKLDLQRENVESAEITRMAEKKSSAIERKPLKELKLVRMKAVEENASELINKNEEFAGWTETYSEEKELTQKERKRETPETPETSETSETPETPEPTEIKFFDATEEIPSEEHDLCQKLDGENESLEITEDKILYETENNHTEGRELVQGENIEVLQPPSPINEIKISEELKDFSAQEKVVEEGPLEAMEVKDSSPTDKTIEENALRDEKEVALDAMHDKNSDAAEETSAKDHDLVQDRGDESSEAIKDGDLDTTDEASEGIESPEVIEVKAPDEIEEISSVGHKLSHGDTEGFQAVSIPTIVIDVYEEFQEASLNTEKLTQEQEKENPSNSKDSDATKETSFQDELASERDVDIIKDVSTPTIKIDVYEELQEASHKAKELSQKIHKEETVLEATIYKELDEAEDILDKDHELTQVIDDKGPSESMATEDLNKLKESSLEERDSTQVLEERTPEVVEVQNFEEAKDILDQASELTEPLDEKELLEKIAVKDLDATEETPLDKPELAQVLDEKPSEVAEVDYSNRIEDILIKEHELNEVADEKKLSEKIEDRGLDKTEEISLDEQNLVQMLEKSSEAIGVKVLQGKSFDENDLDQNEGLSEIKVGDMKITEETPEGVLAREVDEEKETSEKEKTSDATEEKSFGESDLTKVLDEKTGSSELMEIKSWDVTEIALEEKGPTLEVDEGESLEEKENENSDATEETSFGGSDSTEVLEEKIELSEATEIIDAKDMEAIEEALAENEPTTETDNEREIIEAVKAEELETQEVASESNEPSYEEETLKTFQVKNLDEVERISIDERSLTQVVDAELSEVMEVKDLDSSEEASNINESSHEADEKEPLEAIEIKNLDEIQSKSVIEHDSAQAEEAKDELSEVKEIKDLNAKEEALETNGSSDKLDEEDLPEAIEIRNLDEIRRKSVDEHDLAQVLNAENGPSEVMEVKDLDGEKAAPETNGSTEKEEIAAAIQIKYLDEVRNISDEEHELTQEKEHSEKMEIKELNSKGAPEIYGDEESLEAIEVNDLDETKETPFNEGDLTQVLDEEESSSSEMMEVKDLDQIQVTNPQITEKKSLEDFEEHSLKVDDLAREIEEKKKSSELEEKALAASDNISSKECELTQEENVGVLQPASLLINEIELSEISEKSSLKENDLIEGANQHREKEATEILASSPATMEEKLPEYSLVGSTESLMEINTCVLSSTELRESDSSSISGNPVLNSTSSENLLGLKEKDSDSCDILSNSSQDMEDSLDKADRDIPIKTNGTSNHNDSPEDLTNSNLADKNQGNIIPLNSVQLQISQLPESEDVPNRSEQVNDLELSTEDLSTSTSNFDAIAEESERNSSSDQNLISEETKERMRIVPEGNNLLNQSETGILSRYKRSISFEVSAFKGWFSTTSQEPSDFSSVQNKEILQSTNTTLNSSEPTANSAKIHAIGSGDEEIRDITPRETVIESTISPKPLDQIFDDNKGSLDEKAQGFHETSSELDTAEPIENLQTNIEESFVHTEDPKDIGYADINSDTNITEVNLPVNSEAYSGDVDILEIKEEIHGVDNGSGQEFSVEQGPESVNCNEPVSIMNADTDITHEIESTENKYLLNNIPEREFRTGLDTIYESASLPHARLPTPDAINDDSISVNNFEISQYEEKHPESEAGDEGNQSSDNFLRRNEINHSPLQLKMGARSDDEHSEDEINKLDQASNSELLLETATTKIESVANQSLNMGAQEHITNDFEEVDSICSYTSQGMFEDGDEQFTYEDYHDQRQISYEDEETSSQGFDVDYGVPESESIPAYDDSDGPSAPTSPSEAPSSPFHENPIDEPIISSTWQIPAQDPLDEHPQEFKPIVDTVSVEYDHYQSYSDAMTPRQHHFTIPDQHAEELLLKNSLSSPNKIEQMIKSNDTFSKESSEPSDHDTKSKNQVKDQPSDTESSSASQNLPQPIIASTVSVVQRARAVFEAQQDKRRENQTRKINPRPLSGFFNHRGSALAYRAKRNSNPPASVIEEDEQDEQELVIKVRPYSMDQSPNGKRFTSGSPTTKAREQSRLSFFEGLKNGAPNPNLFSQQ